MTTEEETLRGLLAEALVALHRVRSMRGAGTLYVYYRCAACGKEGPSMIVWKGQLIDERDPMPLHEPDCLTLRIRALGIVPSESLDNRWDKIEVTE